MKHSHSRGKRIGVCLAVLGIVVGGGGSLVEAGGLAPCPTREVQVGQGRSLLLSFQRMRRVQVVDPKVLEVVIGSLNDLCLYGMAPGKTTVYVWDKLGLHQLAVTVTASSPAERLIGELEGILEGRVKLRPLGERTIIVEGELSAAEAERVRAILAAAGRENVQIVDFVRMAGEKETGSAAAALAASLAKLLGEQVEYIVWNDRTLIVRGGVGDKERLAQAHQLLQALGAEKGVKIVDMLEYQPEAAQPPVKQIAEALGEGFRVWHVYGRAVAVEGSVETTERFEALQKVLDAFKEQAEIINLVRIGKPDINQAVASLQQLLGDKLAVRALDSERIAVEGLLPDEKSLQRVHEILQNYPVGYKVVELFRVALPEKRQVLVKVRVVDINTDDLQRLGLRWGQVSGGEFRDQPWVMQVMSSALGGTGEVGNVYPIGALLEALRQKNAARILSQPNLLVDEGGEATITVGGEIPVPVAQSGTAGGAGGAITIEWKPYGVILKVAPTILEGGQKINLQVSPEVSSLDFGNAITMSGFTLPAIRQRKASTVVTIDDGGTLVLGGLLQHDQARALTKIPLLGDLPVIGELFRRREFKNGQSELVILVTPEIVKGPMPIPPIAQPEKLN